MARLAAPPNGDAAPSVTEPLSVPPAAAEPKSRDRRPGLLVEVPVADRVVGRHGGAVVGDDVGLSGGDAETRRSEAGERGEERGKRAHWEVRRGGGSAVHRSSAAARRTEICAHRAGRMAYDRRPTPPRAAAPLALVALRPPRPAARSPRPGRGAAAVPPRPRHRRPSAAASASRRAASPPARVPWWRTRWMSAGPNSSTSPGPCDASSGALDAAAAVPRATCAVEDCDRAGRAVVVVEAGVVPGHPADQPGGDVVVLRRGGGTCAARGSWCTCGRHSRGRSASQRDERRAARRRSDRARRAAAAVMPPPPRRRGRSSAAGLSSSTGAAAARRARAVCA